MSEQAPRLSSEGGTADNERSRYRLGRVDVARGVALLAMATYHFSWDIEFFGYLEPGTANTGFLKLYARCIASSFLFLAGMSLFWAHENGFSRSNFARRLFKVGGAALLISVATWFATPDAFIFFGILHHILLASILGLAFIRLPAPLTLLAAAFCVAAPHYLRHDIFNQWSFYWIGLSTRLPLSNDYVPLFPWFGAVLGGIAAARLISTFSLKAWLASPMGKQNVVYRLLGAAGRHSLAIYLVHQPLLIALVWTIAQLAPPAQTDPRLTFINDCKLACISDGGRKETFCTNYCGCMLESLTEANALVDGQLRAKLDGYDEEIEGIAEQCAFRSQ